MKIIIVGGSGTIGSAVAGKFRDHEVLIAGRKSAGLAVDISSADSIRAFFKAVGPFDALICASGGAHIGPIATMDEKDLAVGIQGKLLGQINLVLIGQHCIRKGGSFTLTSGILAEESIPGGVAASTVDGAVNTFVRAASTQLENDVRINAVAPGVIEESPGLHPYFPGHIPVPVEWVAMAYVKSVCGVSNGTVIKAY